MANFTAVTPSDTVALPAPVAWLYIGVTGDVAVIAQGDSVAVTFKSVPAGWVRFPSRVGQVMATGTTATNIVAATGDQPASH